MLMDQNEAMRQAILRLLQQPQNQPPDPANTMTGTDGNDVVPHPTDVQSAPTSFVPPRTQTSRRY